MARAWTGAQIGIAYALLEAALWTEGSAQKTCSGVAAVWILLAVLMQRRPAEQLGVGRQGLRQSLWVIPVGAAAAAMAVAVAWGVGSLHVLWSPKPVAHALLYVVWATVQQFILQSFFFVNLEELLGEGRKALLASALLFSAAHIPNPVLVGSTFVAALFLTAVFRRYRNIYPLGVAHGLLGLALAVSAPDALLRHMRVGIAYLHFPMR
jgi:membrane protease YdiL (CAAX protease family)